MAPFKNKIGSSSVWVTPCENVRMLVHIQLQNCIKFKYSAEMQSSILDGAGSADNRSSTGYLHYLVQELRIAALRVVGCQGVKVFSLKDVIITTSVNTVIFITITIWVFELSQFFFLVLYNLSFWVWSQFDLSNFVTIFFCCFITVWVIEFCHNLGFFLVLSSSDFV